MRRLWSALLCGLLRGLREEAQGVDAAMLGKGGGGEARLVTDFLGLNVCRE